MAITITASFDSVDMADLARARLREHGVEYADMKIEEKAKPHNTAGIDDPRVAFNPWNPLFTNGPLGFGAGVATNAIPYGGLMFNWDSAGLMNPHMSQDVAGIASSDTSDVRMSLTVRNEEVKHCEAILTSCHATALRRG